MAPSTSPPLCPAIPAPPDHRSAQPQEQTRRANRKAERLDVQHVLSLKGAGANAGDLERLSKFRISPDVIRRSACRSHAHARCTLHARAQHGRDAVAYACPCQRTIGARSG